MIDLKGMTSLTQEASELSRKRNPTAQEKRRLDFCLAGISAIKAGASLDEVEAHEDNERRSRVGLAPIRPSNYTKEQRNEVAAFQALVEKRDVEGAPMTAQIGTYTGLGYFVPTGFFGRVFESMKAADVLFDDAFCTQIRTTNGRPMTIPTMDDTEHTASVISEAGSQTEVDIDAPGQAVVGAYSYASRRYSASLESIQDLDSAITVLSLFRSFTAKALARGIGSDLLKGNGSGKTLGLVPALAASSISPVTAAGSAANDDSSATGANSLGTQDFANAFDSLDAAYLSSLTCAWIMNVNTLGALYKQLDKYGRPIVSFTEGAPTILGKPVKISPSMDNIDASNVPVLLGDLSYWATRIVTPGTEDGLGIKAYTEAPGLAENGMVGLRSFVRADGALLWNSGPCPFTYIRCHS